MKAGFCTTDISLPVGHNLSGGGIRNLSTRALAPLKIRAAVLSDGKLTTAIAAVDTCGIEKRLIDEALAEVKNVQGSHLIPT